MGKMIGFKELQLEQTRNVNDGVHHATLLNIIGASGGGECGVLRYRPISEGGHWQNELPGVQPGAVYRPRVQSSSTYPQLPGTWVNPDGTIVTYNRGNGWNHRDPSVPPTPTPPRHPAETIVGVRG